MKSDDGSQSRRFVVFIYVGVLQSFCWSNFEIPVSADPGCDQITNWVTVYAAHTVEVK